MKITKNIFYSLLLFAVLLPPAPAYSTVNNPDTDWMAGCYGVGFHFLARWKMPNSTDANKWNSIIDGFDVNKFASDVSKTGAKWVLFTLGQNDQFYCSPNAVINKYSGYKPGEACSLRDLPMDMANALEPYGIKLILYLPSNAPKLESKIANGMGLTTTDANGNWHVSSAFISKWSEVIKEWSDRYKDKVIGWWFDGFYGSNGFQWSYANQYAAAAKSGNSHTIVAYNDGGFAYRDDAQDYAAGEALDQTFSKSCTTRWLDGKIQCHRFIPYVSWPGGGTSPYTDTQVIDETNKIITAKGGVTWNLGVNTDGTIYASELAAFVRMRSQFKQCQFSNPPACQPASASADDGNVPVNVLDNNLSTRWSADGDGQWIKLCLYDSLLANRIRIAFFKGNERTSTFDLEVSRNGTTWTTAISGAMSSGITLNLEPFSFPLQWVKYARVTGHGNNINTWNSYTEIILDAVSTEMNESRSSAIPIVIYPNPADANGTIQIKNISPESRISIVNALGQHVWEETVHSHAAAISLQGWTEGIYLMNIIDNQKTEIQKFYIR